MSGFMTFLIIVGLLVVVLNYTDRRRRLYVDRTEPKDAADRSRMIADLEAHQN